jgi:hypothetical protein
MNNIDITERLINELQKAAGVQVYKDDKDREWSKVALSSLDYKYPEPATVVLATLAGLVDFADNFKSSDQPAGAGPALIHIENHGSVRLISHLYGNSAQRLCFAQAQFQALFGDKFKFDCFYPQEAFVIYVQTLFEMTEQAKEMLALIGTIKENQVKTSLDDGITQTVEASAGAVLVKTRNIPNPVVLRPYRTFREIGQPESPFILRVKPGEDSPMCALFEADGGKWKLQAMNNIKLFLEDAGLNLPIIC